MTDRAVPLIREFAGAGSPATASDAFYQSMLTADWQWRGARGGVYSLFQEMEDKDAHLFATLQTRKNMLAGCDWKVIAASEEPRDKEICEVVRGVIGRIPNFHGALFQLMDALAKGFSIAEVMWDIRASEARVGVASIRPRCQADFAFGPDSALYFLEESTRSGMATDRGKSPELLPRPGEMMVYPPAARRMPERKFLHFAFQGGNGSPYGSPLCAKAYWYYWFKKNNLKFWAVYNEKFGSPTAVARYGIGTTTEELSRLSEVIGSLQNDSGILLPEGIALEFLEARRTGAGSTYRELADWCNDEISKIVLGQTLTTSEGRRSGSLALGNVHDAVRREYLAADARSLADVLSNQLVRWIVDFNFGVDALAPRLVFEHSETQDLKAELELDEQLVRMGVGLPVSYFHEKYRRPLPRAGERVLRYDDANLYQYHVQYGILTINEVRALLGLEGVSWGNRPPQAGGDAAGSGEETLAQGTDKSNEERRDRRNR